MSISEQCDACITTVFVFVLFFLHFTMFVLLEFYALLVLSLNRVYLNPLTDNYFHPPRLFNCMNLNLILTEYQIKKIAKDTSYNLIHQLPSLHF